MGAAGPAYRLARRANLYLEPEASFAACQRLGQTTTEPLTINQQTLEQRLRERGLLASVEHGRSRLRVRVRGLEGKRRSVLHLLAASLFPEGSPAAPEGTNGRPSCSLCGSTGRCQGRVVMPDGGWVCLAASRTACCGTAGSMGRDGRSAAGRRGQVQRLPLGSDDGERDGRDRSVTDSDSVNVRLE